VYQSVVLSPSGDSGYLSIHHEASSNVRYRGRLATIQTGNHKKVPLGAVFRWCILCEFVVVA
jgi:hypothetical protein